MSDNVNYADLVSFIAKALVDDPDQVKVSEATGPRGTLLELSVSDRDIGKVIGKEGKTAQSIRTLLSAASAKGGRRVNLDILD